MKQITVAINIPSGKAIIAGDCVLELYDEPSSVSVDQMEKNTGRVYEKKFLREYANQGVAFGYIGNTTPCIVQKNPDEILLQNKRPTEEHLLGEFCTDWGRYFIADYEEYLKRGGNAPEEGSKFQQPRVIEIPSGRYVIEHFYGLQEPWNLTHPWDGVYARLKRSDAPLPAQPRFLEEVLENNLLKMEKDNDNFSLSFIHWGSTPETYSVMISVMTDDSASVASFTVPFDNVENQDFLFQEIEKARQEAIEREARFEEFGRNLRSKK